MRFPAKLPLELRAEIESWPEKCQSPYSYSFYNVPPGQKTWDVTPEGSLRISDHWNFGGHCPTSEPVKNGWWTLAQWREGRYHVIKTLKARSTIEFTDEEARVHLNRRQQDDRDKRLKEIRRNRRERDKARIYDVVREFVPGDRPIDDAILEVIREALSHKYPDERVHEDSRERQSA